MTALLTEQRNALWDAIEHYQDFDHTKFQKFRCERDIGAVGYAPSGPGDIPAILIRPAKLDTEWAYMRAKEFRYLLDIVIYTKTLPAMEQAVEGVWDAIYRATKTGDVPYYTANGTNAKPPTNLGVSFSEGQIGNDSKTLNVWIGLMSLGMNPRRDIFGP